MTTRERTEAASPLEKFEVLAEEIDRLRDELRRMRRGSSINDQLETVDLGDRLLSDFAALHAGDRVLA